MQVEISKDTCRTVPAIRVFCVVCNLPVGRISSYYGKAMCWKCEKEIYEESLERFQKGRPVEIKKDRGEGQRNENTNRYNNYTERLKLKKSKESKGWKKEMSDTVKKVMRNRYNKTW